MSAGTPEGPGAAVPASGETAPVCYRHPKKETWISCQRCGRPICPDCMNDASVGFQCPDCVKEGARSTRQAKGAYGGARALDVGRATMGLVGLNVVVFLVITLTKASSDIVDRLALLPRTTTYGFDDGSVRSVQGVSDGAYWQLVTSMFSHVQLWHLGVNMLSLYFLGPMLEATLGRARFLAVYLVSGLVGGAAVMWFSAPSTSVVGASGAIFGLLGSLLVLVLKRGLDPRQILFWLGINLVLTFFSGINISWQAHVGGLVGGALVTAIIAWAPRKNREIVQWAGIGLVTVLTVVAVVVRALQLG